MLWTMFRAVPSYFHREYIPESAVNDVHVSCVRPASEFFLQTGQRWMGKESDCAQTVQRYVPSRAQPTHCLGNRMSKMDIVGGDGGSRTLVRERN